MNPQVEFNLALILFLPWFLILAALYWWFPRQPRHAARRVFDLGALALSVFAFLATIHWAQRFADPRQGRMWAQILATSMGYGVFLAGIALASLIRWRCLRRR